MACVGVVEWRHFAALRDESDAWFSVALWEHNSGAVLRSRGSKALRQCRPQPVKVKALVWQQVQGLPDRFRRSAALTRDLAQEKALKFSRCKWN
ncbi:TPA: hypothetical protein ACRRZ8_001289 [Escherichia fergusonii]|uniref:hypothetical protein n=1 Tax=Escherichia fergusonii TaxID=564 RepID=UPI0035C1EA26